MINTNKCGTLFRLHIPPSCTHHPQLVRTVRSEKKNPDTDRKIREAQYLLVWVCFFYHFLVSPQVMYHGGCILFARHSLTVAPPICLQFRINPPCAFVRVSALWLPFDWPCLRLLFLTFPRSHPGNTGSQMSLFSNFNSPSPSVVAYTQFSSRIQLFSSLPPLQTHTDTHKVHAPILSPKAHVFTDDSGSSCA